MTWTEVAELTRRTAVALVPTGSTEAHGPHLPLQTDVLIAEGAARRAVALLEAEGVLCAIAPAFCYGVTNMAMPFAGTVTIAAGTLTQLTLAVCRSLAAHGFTRIVFSNHHLEPAHVAAMLEGARLATEAGLARVAIPDVREERWAATLTEEFRAGARHGGAYETSLVLAERPDLVREDRLRGLAPIWVDLPARIRAGARTFREAGSEWAYFGDPARATREDGEQIFAALARMLAATVKELL
jgi:creatinine amidohydrolase